MESTNDPGTAGGGSDPSVAVDDGGLLYLGFVNEDKFRQ